MIVATTIYGIATFFDGHAGKDAGSAETGFQKCMSGMKRFEDARGRIDLERRVLIIRPDIESPVGSINSDWFLYIIVDRKYCQPLWSRMPMDKQKHLARIKRRRTNRQPRGPALGSLDLNRHNLSEKCVIHKFAVNGQFDLAQSHGNEANIGAAIRVVQNRQRRHAETLVIAYIACRFPILEDTNTVQPRRLNDKINIVCLRKAQRPGGCRYIY